MQSGVLDLGLRPNEIISLALMPSDSRANVTVKQGSWLSVITPWLGHLKHLGALFLYLYNGFENLKKKLSYFGTISILEKSCHSSTKNFSHPEPFEGKLSP